MTADIVLASASPRRRELLERMGLRLHVQPADIDEAPHPDEDPLEYVRRVAKEKCVALTERLNTATLPVLAADTTVIRDHAILGKPLDATEAASMLRSLSGRHHEVATAYCIAYGGQLVERTVVTQVNFRSLQPAEMQAYVACGEWNGKAGGYAIQDKAAAFVTDIRGSFTNVMGLPLAEVLADLRSVDALPDYPRAGFGVTGP